MGRTGVVITGCGGAGVDATGGVLLVRVTAVAECMLSLDATRDLDVAARTSTTADVDSIGIIRLTAAAASVAFLAICPCRPHFYSRRCLLMLL